MPNILGVGKRRDDVVRDEEVATADEAQRTLRLGIYPRALGCHDDVTSREDSSASPRTPMDASPQVSRHRQTCVDAAGRLKSTSQAEYAGSIPVIGSAIFQLGGIFRDCQRPSEVIF
jgi:hypothetical protein